MTVSPEPRKLGVEHLNDLNLSDSIFKQKPSVGQVTRPMLGHMDDRLPVFARIANCWPIKTLQFSFEFFILESPVLHRLCRTVHTERTLLCTLQCMHRTQPFHWIVFKLPKTKKFVFYNLQASKKESINEKEEPFECYHYTCFSCCCINRVWAFCLGARQRRAYEISC